MFNFHKLWESPSEETAETVFVELVCLFLFPRLIKF